MSASPRPVLEDANQVATLPSPTSRPTLPFRAMQHVGTSSPPKAHVVFIDPDPSLRTTCAQLLQQEEYDVAICGQGDEALELVRRRAFDVAFVDLYMPRVGGPQLMRAILETNPRAAVILMTADASVEGSTQALRDGAWDVLAKPFTAVQLQMLALRASNAVRQEREEAEVQPVLRLAGGKGDALELLGVAPGFRKVIALASRVAKTNASVFITGESGCGKELVAQFIHQESQRAGRPFVAVNCGAVPEGLIESEMFGHRKGAFTGAVRDKPGLLETADGGTLFLDELLEMPTAAQTKLLRVIQDGVVRRVGSESNDKVVDVRFIAATNRDPEEAIARGELREDLFYRLCVVHIKMPPLRRRPEDIPLLATHFLRLAWRRREARRAMPRLSPDAFRALCEHPWRGNVRELQNVIEHVAAFAESGAEIRREDLPLHEARPSAADASRDAAESTATEGAYHPARERAIAEFESQYVRSLVDRTGGNLSEAARIAGVARTTLYLLLQRVGLERHAQPGVLRERSTPTQSAAAGRWPSPMAGELEDDPNMASA